MTTKEHLDQLNKYCYGNNSIPAQFHLHNEILRHVLTTLEAKPQSPASEAAAELVAGIKDARLAEMEGRLKVLEAASKYHDQCIDQLEDLLPNPEPDTPAVPDPQPGDIWAGKNKARAVCDTKGELVRFVIAGDCWYQDLTFDAWQTWVRETGARRIWPEGGGA